MCVVSMVHDWGRNQPWAPAIPQSPTIPDYSPAKQLTQDEVNKLKEFLRLLEAAEIFDKKTNQPECTDDRKDKFKEAVQKLLDEYK